MTLVPAWRRLGLKLKSETVGEEVNGNHSTDTPHNGNGKRKAFSGKTPNDQNTGQQSAKRQKLTQDSTSSKPTRVVFSDETDNSSKRPLSPKSTTKPKPILKRPAPETDETPPTSAAAQPESAAKPQPTKLKKKRKSKSAKAKSKSSKSSKAASKSKSSGDHLSYLTQFATDHAQWKFNKAKQTHLLKHAFDLDVIPAEHDDVLVAYVKGLQGESAQGRLRAEAEGVLEEPWTDSEAGQVDEGESSNEKQEPTDSSNDASPAGKSSSPKASSEKDMDRAPTRKAAKREAAAQDVDRLKTMLKSTHALRESKLHAAKYPKKLEKRRRAEAVLSALRFTDPQRQSQVTRDRALNGAVERLGTARPDADVAAGTNGKEAGLSKDQKAKTKAPADKTGRLRGTRGRKRRILQTGVPDDDEMSSSSSSSSEEESESEDGDSDSSDSSGSSEEHPQTENRAR